MRRLLLLFPLLLFVAACGADDDAAEAPAIEGPALVMFYTDN